MCVCVCKKSRICSQGGGGATIFCAIFTWTYNPGDGDGRPVDLAHVESLQHYFVEGGIGASG